MKITADNSMLECAATCSQKFVVQYILGLRAGNQGPLVAGRAVHAGLKKYWDLPANARDFTQLGLIVGAAEYCYYAVDDSDFETRYTLANVVDILTAWYHTKDEFPFNHVHSEIAFELPFSGEWTFAGKIDLVGRLRATGQLCPVDYKFSGQVNQGWWQTQWRLKGQMIGYCWAASQMYAEDVSTAYVYGIKATTLPQPGRKCKTHGVDAGECREQHLVTELTAVYYDAQAMEDWATNARFVFAKVEELYGWHTQPSYYKASQEGRFNGGCTFCEFGQWCAAGRPEGMLSMFQKGAKEPWKL